VASLAVRLRSRLSHCVTRNSVDLTLRLSFCRFHDASTNEVSGQNSGDKKPSKNGAFSRLLSGHPQQNGRHERMHLTLKKEATRPPGFNSLQQQERFDAFVQEFNAERPHEALDMKCPAERCSASPRKMTPCVFSKMGFPPSAAARSACSTTMPPRLCATNTIGLLPTSLLARKLRSFKPIPCQLA
jgi:hypothetical protein